jgi:ribonuclease PH
MERKDGRANHELRPVIIEPDFVEYPEGSVLISFGKTRLLCNVSIEDTIPKWLRDSGKTSGWITAEYSLLPRSTQKRTTRETSGLRGRTQEIRRMIGRSLRAAIDLDQLGERTCIVDCDVIQADGSTRAAAVTGGYVALALALRKLIQQRQVPESILSTSVAAVSVGILAGNPILDLTYEEDYEADVDLNVVLDGNGNYVEIQGTAEGKSFSPHELKEMLKLAHIGIEQLHQIQSASLNSITKA